MTNTESNSTQNTAEQRLQNGTVLRLSEDAADEPWYVPLWNERGIYKYGYLTTDCLMVIEQVYNELYSPLYILLADEITIALNVTEMHRLIERGYIRILK